MFLLLLHSILCFASLPKEEANWIWPKAFVAQKAKTGEIFLLQAQFAQNDSVIARGPSPFPWPNVKLHLVFRLDREPEVGKVLALFERVRRNWERAGVKIIGLQLDYDSPTSKLASYANTVKQLREKLPKEFQLSVTGLSDWIEMGGNNRLVESWNGVEIFYQLYQGKRPHQNLEKFISRTKACKSSFRLGLLPGQNLTLAQKAILEKNENFRGYIRFQGD